MITFFFSYLELGGVPILFYNIATELYKKKISYKLIARTNSEIFHLFNRIQPAYFFVPYETANRLGYKSVISHEDILIISHWEPKLYLLKDVNPLLFFWNVFPDTLMKSNLVRKEIILHIQNKRLLKTMYSKGGLCFMDNSAKLFLEKYNIIDFENDENYLPIPVCVENNRYKYVNSMLKDSTLQISYVGRSEIWKLFPILKIVSDIQKSKYCNRVHLNIITNDKNASTDFLKTHLIDDKFILNNISFYENVSNSELSNLLLKISNLNIGMGTACLEGARVGIPSLLIDASYQVINSDYRYRWIYSIDKYNLGNIYSTNYNNLGLFLDEIIYNSLSLDSYLNDESVKCFNYVKYNHSLSLVYKKFSKVLSRSKLRFNDIASLVFKYTWIYKLKLKLKSLLEYEKS